MVDISIIKNATIGLGLIDKNDNIRVVGGSGIVINPKGYFLTASHVLQKLGEKRLELLDPKEGEEKLETWLSIISYIPRPDGTFSLITNVIEKWIPFELEFDKLDFDIGMGWPKTKETDHPILKISKRLNFSPLEHVTMCGYPGGSTTLNPYGNITDLSLSPMIEIGTIGSLRPADDAPAHQGMLLNIVTTGGSSGSPIIDENNEIIGIVQWVIGAPLFAKTSYEDSAYILKEDKLIEDTLKKTSATKGYAQVGKTFALSSTMFSDCYKAIEQIESGATKITGLNANHSKTLFIKNIKS